MAQILTLHPGYHNEDLAAASERLTREGSWKKQRIVYVIPGGDKICAEAYLSHRSLIFPPNQAMVPFYIKNAEVGSAFQAHIDHVLTSPLREFEYLFTIEHDNIPQPNHVLKLLEAMETHPELSAISGLYWTKGYGGAPQIWGDKNDPVENYRPQRPVPNKVIECWGIGMGFCLYRMEMFRKLEEKKVPKPWFKTVGKSSEDQGMGTQDLYFWGRVAHPNGFRCGVDCSVKVGHIDDKGMIW